MLKNKACILLAVIGIFSAQDLIQASSIEVSGRVSGNWIVDTVHVVGNIEIKPSEILQIDEGVTVLFQGPYFFRVLGCLKALGSPGNPILFTISDTTGFYNDTIANGGWKQIRIENQSELEDSTRLKHCHFEYGKAVTVDSLYSYGGAICIRNSNRISITHCEFRNNYAYFSGGAVYIENAAIRISGNHFEYNRCGQPDLYYGYGGGLCADSSAAIIEKNYFRQNASTGIGGGLCIRFSDGPVQHNIFEENYSALGGGFGMLHIDTCRFVISNNLITDNTAKFFGGGISNGDCSPTYINNTIVENNCTGGGGGFYCKDSVVPVLINNIIYGNTQYGGEINQVYLWDNLSQPHFYHNNIQGGIAAFAGSGGADFTGKYVNNIDQDPFFENASYAPALLSPCVNSGSLDLAGMMIPLFDLAGNTRVVADTIDMGAFEQQEVLGIFNDDAHDPLFLKVYPNPTNSTIQIAFELLAAEHLIVFVTDMQGITRDKIWEKSLVAGHHRINWDLMDYPDGTYVIVMKTSNGLLKKVVIRK
ncbi:MAG: right-handed parallel beta-helix repeat-containing protein [Bacteroidetes bacterium]|nr:right-handed parallel beta-helix repeat-containing protein [Bacteroidota bacterium]